MGGWRQEEGRQIGNEGLKVMYLNVQSLNKKMNELRANVCESKPDVVLIVESWTHDGISDAFLKLEGFELIERKDRNDKMAGRGGGLLMYARRDLCAWKEELNGKFNQAGKMVVKSGKEELAIKLVYRSLNSKKENDMDLCEWVKTMKGDFVIFGYFNFPGINWGTGRSDVKGREFISVIENKFISQHVTEMTHISGNILDLILSSSENLINEVGSHGRLGGSDHEILMCTVGLPMVKKEKEVKVKDYKNGNYEEMRKNLNLNWEKVMEEMSVEASWEMIKTKLEKETEENVPLKTQRNRSEPKWMTREIKTMIRKKKRLWNKARGSGRAKDKCEYKKVEKEKD